MISKEQFVNLIEALENQHRIDVAYANSLSTVLNSECNIYDNSVLSNSIIDLLRDYFPKQDGFCEIEHYCYYQNFGRVETEEAVIVETAAELYNRLINNL